MGTDFRRAPYLSDYWTTRDFLRFHDFCSPLLSILMEAQTPLTVGVFGPWGSGKTSLLRMLKEEIDRKDLRFVRTVWFTAWKYDREEALWRAFILRVLKALYPRVPREQWGDAEKELAAHLDRMVESVYRAVEWEEAARWALDLGRLGKEAAKLPGFLLLSSVGAQALAQALGIDPKLAETVRREVQTARMEQLVSMEQFEDRFRQALAMALKVEGEPEDRRRLVVFVDDLDRCLPEKAVEVLEAIKLFLEVEGAVFVLGMDREVIERGIETRYAALFRRTGEDERPEMPVRGDIYLQKIVQIPFHLPPLSVEDVEAYIRKLEEDLPPDARLGEMTRQVFARGLFPNPRQVKRALNIFRLLKAIAEERLPAGSVAWPLLAKTVLIQTQWPDLYRLWRQYPMLVQTLEEEYARRPRTEEEVVRGRHLRAGEEAKAESARKGDLLEPYLTRLTEYGLLYRLLTFPEKTGEGEERARFAGLTRSQMEVYVRLAGAVEPEAPAVEVPGDLWADLLSGDRARIQDALARLEEQEMDREGPLHRQMREGLLRVMRDPSRPARERVSAGDALALLGDPRFRPDLWYLPDEPLLGFVEIPGGPFLMGSDPQKDPMAYDDETPQHLVTLPTYYIARYPVTVAQFRAFVEATGYDEYDPKSLQGPDNHPVVRVTWHEALAYCWWLMKVLQKEAKTRERATSETEARFWQELTQGKLVITLPSEAEWEKAARGTEGQRYPWGNNPDPEQANYDDTGIGTTSAVGCFPGGASPYGVEDLSGNVSEWTRSLWGKRWDRADFGYPYDPQNGRENLRAGLNVRRVLRGGSFFSEARSVRCASRAGSDPGSRGEIIGFRVVASPVSAL